MVPFCPSLKSDFSGSRVKLVHGIVEISHKIQICLDYCWISHGSLWPPFFPLLLCPPCQSLCYCSKALLRSVCFSTGMALIAIKSSKFSRTELKLWEVKEYFWISIIPWSKHQSPAKKHFSPQKNWPGKGDLNTTNCQKTRICSTWTMGRKRGKKSKLLPPMTGWLEVCTKEKGGLDA